MEYVFYIPYLLLILVITYSEKNGFIKARSVRTDGLVEGMYGPRFIPMKINGSYVMVDLLKTNDVSYEPTEKDVTYYLYTNKNKDEPEIITSIENMTQSKYFNPSNPVLFIVHGWTDSGESDLNTLIKNASLGIRDLSIFVVDWHGPAGKDYITSRLAVSPVGEFVGNFINNLTLLYPSLDLADCYLAGHSLGAHVAGNAGAAVNGLVGHIIGLDPAGPLFLKDYIHDRLDPTDASYVQIIHSNAGLLGFADALGDADFYPNGGSYQPGCGLDIDGACSHCKSYRYYAKSIKDNGLDFIGWKCSSYDGFLSEECVHNEKGTMGGLIPNNKLTGTFYLQSSNDNNLEEK